MIPDRARPTRVRREHRAAQLALRASRAGGIALLWCAWASLIACATQPASAQSRSSSAIRGSVTLPDGTPATQALASLEDLRTGVERTALTNASGQFLLLGLQPGGPYRLTIALLGFAPIELADIQLIVGETRLLRFIMSIEAIEVEGIDVESARADLFDPGRVGPVTLVSADELLSVPLISREITDLAVLSPLVTRTESGGLSIAGQNERYNSLLIDGLPAKDPFGLTPGGLPGGQAGAKLIPIDAVAQYEVLVAPYDVRLSGFTGGVLNAVTRSGTNELQSRVFAAQRAPQLGGSLVLQSGPVEGSGVSRTLGGFSLGGPVIRDRAHFFVATEFERQTSPPQGFLLGREPASTTRLGVAEVEDASEAIRSFVGEAPGSYGKLELDRELLNVFARFDAQLGASHRLSVRELLARAENDDAPNRLGFDPYGLSSNGVRRSATSNSLSAELTSILGRAGTNELSVLLQSSSDDSDPPVAWPQIDVSVLSSVDGVAYLRDVRAGARLTAQRNSLRQSQLRITDHLSFVRGRTTITFGASLARYAFEVDYLPAASGAFRFPSVSAVVDRAPTEFQWSTSRGGSATDFSVWEAGLLAQSELDAGKGLTLRFGLRVDVPWVQSDATRNWDVLNFFGWDTGVLPSGNPLLSPRLSFNWQSDDGVGDTQVRGGMGLFNGQVPFVWMADALQNDGARATVNVCTGGNIPEWTGTLPESCTFTAPEQIRNVTVFASDFRFPQDYRISLGVDHRIGESTISAGLLYNRAFNQVVLSELNLGAPGELGPIEGFGGSLRTYHGRGVPSGFAPNRLDSRFGQVLLASNESEDWAAAATVEFQGRLRDVATRLGYTYSVARDRMSLVSTDMVSNFGFTPVQTDPNRQPLAPSNFQRPHKLVASLSGEPIGDRGPRVSLLYVGQSGAPFSFVYGGDINADGYPGLGAAFERTNDLFYVPDPPSELFLTSASRGLLTQAISEIGCLRDRVGAIVGRNTCRAPWQNSLDARVTQSLPLGWGRIELELDAVNLLNLLNSTWGRVETVRAVVPLVDPIERGEAGPGQPPAPLISRWSGAAIRAEDGSLAPASPWTPVPARSQWQLQFGMRLELGR